MFAVLSIENKFNLLMNNQSYLDEEGKNTYDFEGIVFEFYVNLESYSHEEKIKRTLNIDGFEWENKGYKVIEYERWVENNWCSEWKII